MNLLHELSALLYGLGFPAEPGGDPEETADEYVVLTPVADTPWLYCDNQPRCETQQAELSLFYKGDCQPARQQLYQALLAAGITIAQGRYDGPDEGSGYHCYTMQTTKTYLLEE